MDDRRKNKTQTGGGIQRPREASEDADVVPGFTTTGPTGSQGGRALHGVAPADEEDG